MDYKQHKGNLRGQIKNQVERKLYNKRIRSVKIDVDAFEDLRPLQIKYIYGIGVKSNLN